MKVLAELLRKPKLEGALLGIEIELEGEALPEEVQDWRVENDGSLRGESKEYVFPRPTDRKEAELKLKRLNLTLLRNNNTKIYDTGYAGIHVHVNVLDMTPEDVLKFAFLYYTVEELALRFCGENRTGNLFCLPLSAANYPLRLVRQAFSEQELVVLNDDDIRYASLNWKALPQYGSLEFRGFRSTTDRKDILAWVDILLEMRAKALEPWDIGELGLYASQGAAAFLERFVPNNGNKLLIGEDVDTSVRECFRIIQPVVHINILDAYKGVKPVKKPEAKILPPLEEEAGEEEAVRFEWGQLPQPDVMEANLRRARAFLEGGGIVRNANVNVIVLNDEPEQDI